MKAKEKKAAKKETKDLGGYTPMGTEEEKKAKRKARAKARKEKKKAEEA